MTPTQHDLKLTLQSIIEKYVSFDSSHEPILEYIAHLTFLQANSDNFHFESWVNTCSCYLESFLSTETTHKITKEFLTETESRFPKKHVELDIPEGTGEILCNVEFKLAYGGKILLNTTHFHVRRGRVYGLLGHNGCGKSTLMRAISSGALAGFPGAEELMKLRACFVDHDIDGSNADVPTIDFCMQEPTLAQLGRDKIYEKLLEMDFTDDLIQKPICNLSGGWKMKLALARAILLNADLLLLDEPTNHLDVEKQQWLVDFLNGDDCKNVTTLVVSHDSKFLNKVLTDVIHYENMRLKRYTGNLDKFVEQCPIAKAYFSIHDTDLKFTFPVPSALEGVKSKTKAIIQARGISFTYPTKEELEQNTLERSGNPILKDVTCQLSQASRVACIGPNGAGKSTLIKMLVGETKPDIGSNEIYRHPNMRVAYVAQHAFHHIEKHLEMSPVEYIQWRFSGGLDKEQQAMEAAQMTDAEKAQLKQVFMVYLKEKIAEVDMAGNATDEREVVFQKMEPIVGDSKPPPVDKSMGIFPNCHRVVKELVGRRTRHNEYEYEVKWASSTNVSLDASHNLYVPKVVLESCGFSKLMKYVDDRIAAEAGNVKPLTTKTIQAHLDNFGLFEEFGTYGKIKNLSGGQKVKCVIGASMWFCPHIVILDEPTNYLDRDSLGALSAAISNFEGGCLLISHNAEFFGDIAPEIWRVPGNTRVEIEGADYLDAIKKRELAEAKAKKNSIPSNTEEKFDALGNKIEVQTTANDIDRKYVKNLQKQLKTLKQRIKKGDLSCEDEMYEVEDKLEHAQNILKKEKEASKMK